MKIETNGNLLSFPMRHNALKPCSRCKRVTNLFQYNLCRVCLNQDFKDIKEEFAKHGVTF